MSSAGRTQSRWLSSPLAVLFRQQAFNTYGAAHPWAAHIGAFFFALVILACIGADILALPKHLANRQLRHGGVEVSGIVDHADVRPYRSGKSNTEKYEINVHYHFAAHDGRPFVGASKWTPWTGQRLPTA